MNTVRVSLPLTQSPSSVRWHSDAMMQHKTTGSDAWLWQQDEVPDNELSEAWKTPDAIEMHRRLRFRRTIREETLQHRRIHRHGGIVAGRNIALALRDRECYGGHVYNHKHIAAVAGVSAVAVAGASAVTTPGNVASTMPSSTTQGTGDKSKRQLCPFPGTITEEIRTFAEYCSVVRYHSAFLHHLGGNDDIVNGQRPSSSQAVSTISVAFSPDAQTMASTHGDHTIKITSTNTGNLLQTLDGHPRTPWTVKYHPLDPNILASGCLGHQVRLWNWKTAACLHMIRLEFAIISLSFHPQGSVLAIANGTRLHFWSLDGLLETNIHSKTNANSNNTNTKKTPDEQLQQRRGILTEVEQRHMLRCVHFHPEGKSIIVGGVNATPERSRRVGNLTFYLRLFDFDLALALRPAENPSGGYRRRVISNVSSKQKCIAMQRGG